MNFPARKTRKKVYIFGGLGGDKRAFKNLDLSSFEVVFIDWLKPIKNESIENYCHRLIQLIEDKKPIIIGLSFGGMIAVEISKQIKTKLIILISSSKTKAEIPIMYRIAGKLRLNKLLPGSFFKKYNFITDWFFDIKIKSDRPLLRRILKETDDDFLVWAIDKIINWKNMVEPENYYHIHGTIDRILGFKYIKNADKIKNGGHLMIFYEPQLISEKLKEKILNL